MLASENDIIIRKLELLFSKIDDLSTILSKSNTTGLYAQW